MYTKICQPTSLYTIKMNKRKKDKKVQKLINRGKMQSKEITNFCVLIYKTNMSILIKNHIPGSIFSSINPQKHIFYEFFSFFNNDLVK